MKYSPNNPYLDAHDGSAEQWEELQKARKAKGIVTTGMFCPGCTAGLNSGPMHTCILGAEWRKR